MTHSRNVTRHGSVPQDGAGAAGGGRGEAVPAEAVRSEDGSRTGQPVRVFISYAHESEAHAEAVRALWVLLRANGVDARLDRVAAQRRQDWSLWMTEQVREADCVLVVASRAYQRRAEGQTTADEGRGVQFEAALIRNAFYQNQYRLDRFVPVVLPGQSVTEVPDFLTPAMTTVYHVSEFTVSGAEALLRLLTAQPAEVEPPLGPVPVLGRRDHAYLYVSKDWSGLAVNQPSNLAKPTGFPFPIPASRPVGRPKQPLAGALRTAAEDPPLQTAEPPALSSTVRELAQAIWKSLGQREIERADTLTTLALLESAGRSRNGCLRNSDGGGLPDALFTEVNAAWADFSVGAWGFYAQRERLDGLVLSGHRREFRELSVLFGWRRDKDEIVPPYAEFAHRGDHSRPFYPTLRNPEREQYPRWHDEWLATVMSVHVRLLRWEH